MEKLEPGTRFPTFSAQALEKGAVTIPDDYHGSPVVLLFYRGHW